MAIYFSSRIKEARIYNNLTQVKMAEKIGISRQTYLDLESGKTMPRCDVLVKISEVTNFDIVFFLCVEDDDFIKLIKKISTLSAEKKSIIASSILSIIESIDC